MKVKPEKLAKLLQIYLTTTIFIKLFEFASGDNCTCSLNIYVFISHTKFFINMKK